MRRCLVHEQALWFEEELNDEITRDRESHGKRPLKDKDDTQPPASGSGDGDTPDEAISDGAKTAKCSTIDPESGWFRKGEHKHVFAYSVETACDKHGWILGIHEYVYDEYNGCYICPENQILSYSTTNRDGCREYKGCGYICEKCPYLSQCTLNRNHVKVVTQHVWDGYRGKARMEMKASPTFACKNSKDCGKYPGYTPCFSSMSA